MKSYGFQYEIESKKCHPAIADGIFVYRISQKGIDICGVQAYIKHMNNYSYVQFWRTNKLLSLRKRGIRGAGKEEGGADMMGQNAECCEQVFVHRDLVEKVNRNMPREEELYDLAELFKVFGDSTRIRILFVLFEAEVCVCDLAEILHMTQSAISHQLKILKQAKLVSARREGKSVFYSLADNHVRTIIAQGREHIEE